MTELDRRDTHPPFSKEEVALIRKAVMTPGAPMECPRCSSPLTIEIVAREAQGDGWLIHCADCRHNLVVRDLPERPASEHG